MQVFTLLAFRMMGFGLLGVCVCGGGGGYPLLLNFFKTGVCGGVWGGGGGGVGTHC